MERKTVAVKGIKENKIYGGLNRCYVKQVIDVPGLDRRIIQIKLPWWEDRRAFECENDPWLIRKKKEERDCLRKLLRLKSKEQIIQESGKKEYIFLHWKNKSKYC